jgi:tripartite-type tricarboxylate transporter receptor subunit TctC
MLFGAKGYVSLAGIQKRRGKMERRLSRSLIRFVLLVGLTFLAANSVYPQETKTSEFPNRPVNFIVPWPPGTSADIAFRALGKEAERHLGQPIVVVNKAGGGGSIGTAAVTTAKPDGYTIGQCTPQTLFIVPFLEKVPYQTLKDFKFIMQFGALNPGVVVKATSPFKSFKDLIIYARDNPKKLTYGTNAPNSIANVAMEQIAKKEGVQLTHIPFKGSTEYQTAVLGGHLAFCAGDFQYSLVESGETRVLLFFGEKRSEEYPDVPILKDLSYDFSVPMFLAIFGPKGIPDEITKKLEEVLTKATKESTFLKLMKDQHYTVFYRTSQQLTDFVAKNYEVYEKLLKEMGRIK